METFERSILINAPIDRVFQYCVDPLHMPEWFDNFTEMKHHEGGAPTVYDYTFKMMGIPLHGEVQIVEQEERKMHHAKSTGAVSSDWMWRFEPAGHDGTRLTLHIDYEMKVPVVGPLAEKIVARANEKDGIEALDHLKARLEHN